MNKVFLKCKEVIKNFTTFASAPISRANQFILMMIVFLMTQTSYAFAEDLFKIVGTGVVKTIALIYIAYKVITLIWDAIQKFFGGQEGAMSNIFPIAGYVAVGIAWTPFWQKMAEGAASLLGGY